MNILFTFNKKWTMKKILLLFIFSYQIVMAQLPAGSVVVYPNSFYDSCFANVPNNRYAEYKYNYLPFFPSDSGYIFGNNVYGIKEYVQVYEKNNRDSLLNTALLNTIQALYSSINNVNNSNTSIKIYNVNPTTNEPTTLITASSIVPLNAVSIINFYTNYTISPPISYGSLPNKYALSFVVPADPADSLAIYSTLDPCGGGDSLVWLKQANGSWINLKSWFGASFKVDLHLHPVFDNSLSISQLKGNRPFSLVFNGNSVIVKGDNLANIDNVVFSDLSGKRLKADITKTSSGLEYNFQDLQKGVYTAQISSKDKTILNFKWIK
jgi:hypothetical protein